MDDAERGIAFQLGVHDDAQRIEVVDLIEALIVVVHLVVERIDRLDAPGELKVNAVFAQAHLDALLGLVEEVARLAVALLDAILDLVVADGIQVGKAEVLQLLLDRVDTEAVRKRRIDVHGLQRDGAAAVLPLRREGAHVVQTVAELDEDDADILRHGEQHLADVLDVRLFLVLDVDLLDLGQAVHQHGDALAEFFRDDVKAGLVGAVLYRVVQQRGADRVGVESQLRHDLGNRHGMRNIRLAALALLSFMQFVCVFVGRLDLLAVVVAAAVVDRIPKGLQYAVHSGVHTGFPFIGDAAHREPCGKLCKPSPFLGKCTYCRAGACSRRIFAQSIFASPRQREVSAEPTEGLLHGNDTTPQSTSLTAPLAQGSLAFRDIFSNRGKPTHSARVCVRRRRRMADLSRSARFG